MLVPSSAPLMDQYGLCYHTVSAFCPWEQLSSAQALSDMALALARRENIGVLVQCAVAQGRVAQPGSSFLSRSRQGNSSGCNPCWICCWRDPRRPLVSL